MPGADAPLIDSHSHLDVDAFDADRDAVLARAAAAGVVAHVIAGIDAANWPRIARLCDERTGLWPSYGLHPLFVDRHRPEQLDHLVDWLQRPGVVAVGECGLDHFVDGLDRQRQQHYFEAQLRLARRFDLPVILHARRAVEEVTLALRRIGDLRGVVHSFSGSEEQARQLFELGFHIGIGGPVTYPRAKRIRRLVATMPIEYLLLETDAPDQPCAGHQGERNEPAMIAEVRDAVAALRGCSGDEIAAATSANAVRLFRRAPA